jgi:hypothetical protein
MELIYLSLLYSFFFFSVSAQPSALVLIYSATAGFRHDSIPTAIAALKEKGSQFNVTFDNTEDRAQFTDETLSKYDALVFLSTTGEGELSKLYSPIFI